jgi:hypothetical protein
LRKAGGGEFWGGERRVQVHSKRASLQKRFDDEEKKSWQLKVDEFIKKAVDPYRIVSLF